jgi:hypothetical protein
MQYNSAFSCAAHCFRPPPLAAALGHLTLVEIGLKGEEVIGPMTGACRAFAVRQLPSKNPSSV